MGDKIEPWAVFQHYKGGRYVVICVGKLEATGEEHVVYKSLEHDTAPWVRPLTEFCGEVVTWKGTVPRFKREK